MPEIEVAVVTAVFNGEKYIKGFLQSLESQTFRSFKLYILDDASTDNSYEILKSGLKASRFQFEIFQNISNKGLTQSLIFLTEKLRETYIARLDIDDRWYPSFLSFHYNFLNCNPQISLSCANFYLSFNDNLNEHYTNLGDLNVFISGKNSGYIKQSDLLIRNYIIHSAVFFRRLNISKSGGYNSKFRYAQDYELWLRLLNNKQLLFFHNVVLGNRIIDDNCIGNIKSVEQRIYVLKSKAIYFRQIFVNYKALISLTRDFVSIIVSLFKKMV